jgi:cytochrome c-type biogenesis protein CcmH
MTLFLVLALIVTAIVVPLVVVPLLRVTDGERSPAAAAIAGLLLPLCIAISYFGASNYDWSSQPVASEQPNAAASLPGTPPQPIPDAGVPLDEAIRKLSERLEQQPEDEEGWYLLGTSYNAVGRPKDAMVAFRKAYDISGSSNLDAWLGLAEAMLLDDQTTINGEAGEMIESIVQQQPRNAKALWYGGLVALGQGRNEVAKARWKALLDLEPPERVRQVVMAELGRMGDSVAAPSNAIPDDNTGAAKPSITVTVTLAEPLRSKVKAGAPLFVFVRDAATQGPPVAVLRRTAAELPLTLTISDQDVMIPGRSLAQLKKALVVARVANGGNPLPSAGDLEGEVVWTSKAGEAGSSTPLRIIIDDLVAD